MTRRLKSLVSLAFWISLLLLPAGCGKALYISGLGWHQARVSLRSVPIQEVLSDDRVPPEVQEKIRFVQEVKRYGEDRLGLKRTKSYSTFYELKGPVLYVVTASEKDRLKAHSWTFPIVGRVYYKGFFTQEEALREQRALDRKGYDTYLRPSEAYSTLGWLKDPIFSSMLKWDNGTLANLILHEMVHATAYFKGNNDFSEQIATFIGNQGSVEFLVDRCGPGSPEVARAVESQEDDLLFSLWIERAFERLSAYYSGAISREEKLTGRAEIFLALEEDFRRMQPRFKTKGYRSFGLTPLNNAVLLAHRQYFDRQESFERLHVYLGRNLRGVVEWAKEARASGEDPGPYLDRWLQERGLSLFSSRR
jgi:predicted aminopeptidase